MGRKTKLLYKAIKSPVGQMLILALGSKLEEALRNSKKNDQQQRDHLGSDYKETIDI